MQAKCIYLMKQCKIFKLQKKVGKSPTNSVRAENFPINMKSITGYFKPISSIKALLYPSDEVGGKSTKSADGHQGWGVKSQGGKEWWVTVGAPANRDTRSHWNSAAPWLVETAWLQTPNFSPSRRSDPPAGIKPLEPLLPDEPEDTEPTIRTSATACTLHLCRTAVSDWLREGGWGGMNEVA